MIRLAQLLLLLSAGALWVASRMVWVEVQSFDGLGQPKTTALTGASWSTALVPLALLLLAAAVAALAVRGWPLRLLAVLVAAASAGMAYLAISLWVIRDVAVRAAHLAERAGGGPGRHAAPLRGRDRHVGGRGGHARRCGAAACARRPEPSPRRPAMTRRGAPSPQEAADDVRADDLGRPRRGAGPDRSGQQGSVIDRGVVAATLR